MFFSNFQKSLQAEKSCLLFCRCLLLNSGRRFDHHQMSSTRSAAQIKEEMDNLPISQDLMDYVDAEERLSNLVGKLTPGSDVHKRVSDFLAELSAVYEPQRDDYEKKWKEMRQAYEVELAVERTIAARRKRLDYQNEKKKKTCHRPQP